jgi:hypothetical protein
MWFAISKLTMNCESKGRKRGKRKMSKPRMIGMIKPYTPNSKMDRKKMPFGKKGKKK